MQLSKITGALGASGLTVAQSDDFSLAYNIMNQARQGHGLQHLAWDSDLATYATFWADQMAAGAVPFGHAPSQYRPSQGETLFERQSGGCDKTYDYPLENAANGWLAEGAQWGGQAVASGKESWLHWSQIMWSGTTHVGCARAYGISQPYQVFSVCRFYPEGNIIGQKPY